MYEESRLSFNHFAKAGSVLWVGCNERIKSCKVSEVEKSIQRKYIVSIVTTDPYRVEREQVAPKDRNLIEDLVPLPCHACPGTT